MDRLALEPQENTSPNLAMLANNAHIAIVSVPIINWNLAGRRCHGTSIAPMSPSVFAGRSVPS